MAIDQALNCLVYIPGDDNAGWGMADELLSARAYRCYREGLIGPLLKITIDTLFFWQVEHCFSAFMGEFERRQLPGYYQAHGTPAR